MFSASRTLRRRPDRTSRAVSRRGIDVGRRASMALIRVRDLVTVREIRAAGVLWWMEFFWRGITTGGVVVVCVVAVRLVAVVAHALIWGAAVVLVSVVVAEAGAEAGAVFVARGVLSAGEGIW